MTFTENTCKLWNNWTLYKFYIQLNQTKLLIFINRANNRTHCELITKYFNYIIAIFRLDVYKWKKYTKYKKAIPIELTEKLHVPNNAPCVFFLEGVEWLHYTCFKNKQFDFSLALLSTKLHRKNWSFLTKVRGIIFLLEGDININKFVVENINVYETVTIIILTGYTTNMQISSYNEFKTQILLESVEKCFCNNEGKERILSIICFAVKIAWHIIKTEYYYRCLGRFNSSELTLLLPE